MGEQWSEQRSHAYLAPDYQHDIFVSYSHGDFEGIGESELKAWSQKFVRKLESELRQIPKFRDTVIFLDESKRAEHCLDKTLPLTNQIRAGVEGAALLTILMTPHYLESGWCRDEREWWLKHHREHGDINGRIFVARLWPTEKQWPEVLRDERGHVPLGFWFHAREGDPYRIRPFGWNGRTADQNEFAEALLDFVSVIARRLEELKKELDERRQAQEEANRLASLEGGQLLYLHAREVQREVWDRVWHELDGLGYAVLPGEPEPITGDPQQLQTVKTERTLLLSESDALLLLGSGEGSALEVDMVTIGRSRRNSARAQSGKHLPCAVLDTVGPPVRTEHRLGIARRLGITWIDATQPGWPQAVREWLVHAGERLRNMA
jgi:hypothetical protein